MSFGAVGAGGCTSVQDSAEREAAGAETERTLDKGTQGGKGDAGVVDSTLILASEIVNEVAERGDGEGVVSSLASERVKTGDGSAARDDDERATEGAGVLAGAEPSTNENLPQPRSSKVGRAES